MPDAAGPDPLLVGPNDPLPEAPGAYVLGVMLAAPHRLSIARYRGTVLAAGIYLYCGSARGPGGLAARLGRHFRRDKQTRWHIDHLSAVGAARAALALPGGDECALRRLAATLPGTAIPLVGFGASDCRACPAHLLSASAAATPDWPAPWRALARRLSRR